MKTVFNFICFCFCLFSSSFAQHPRVMVNSDSITNINTRLADYQNYPDLFELYENIKGRCNVWVNHTTPGTYKQLYTRSSNVAFIALLDDNDGWKDKMIQLAKLFDRDFYAPMIETDESMKIAGDPEVNSGFNSTFYTIVPH